MGKKKINSVKVEYEGIEFDSLTEKDFYIHLESNKEKLNIAEIWPHPKYILIEPFGLECPVCKSAGKVISEKTGGKILCKRCRGDKYIKRQGMIYTPDFRVVFKDGSQTIYDVKGFKNERFPMYKKVFENKYRIQLVEVYKKKGEWIYK